MPKHQRDIQSIDIYIGKQITQIAVWLEEGRVVTADTGLAEVRAFATNGTQYIVPGDRLPRRVYRVVHGVKGYRTTATHDNQLAAAWDLMQRVNGDAQVSAELATCDIGGHPIPWADIAAHRRESGEDDDLPACCENCAEREVRP